MRYNLVIRLSSGLGIAGNVLLYFAAFHLLALLVLRKGIAHLFNVDMAFALLPLIACLWGFAYLAIWVGRSDRDGRRFTKQFLLLSICPALIGILMAFVMPLR